MEAFSDNSSETKKKNSHGSYISWSRQEDNLLLEQVQKFLENQKLLNNTENVLITDKKNNLENISETTSPPKPIPNINNINWVKISENFNNKNARQCQTRYQNILDPNRIKGPWTKDEDTKLIELVKKYGPEKWSNISNFLPGRLGKQCRERWYNHLNPEVRKTGWSKEEEWVLFLLHRKFGNSWSIFSEYMPGRTDNTIKNHWNSIMKKNIVGINNQYQEMIKGKTKNEIEKIDENILMNCNQKIKKDYNEYFQEKLKTFPNMKINNCKPITNLFSNEINSERKNISKSKQRKSRKKRISLSLDDKNTSNKKNTTNKLSEVKTPIKEKKKIFTNIKEKKPKSKKTSEIKSSKKKSSKKSVSKITEKEEDNNIMKTRQKSLQKEKKFITKEVDNKNSKKKKNKKTKKKKEKKEGQSMISLNEENEELNKSNKKSNKKISKSKNKTKKSANKKKNKFNIYKISSNKCKSKNSNINNINNNNQTINNNHPQQINNINNINNTEININNFGSPNTPANFNTFGNFGNFSNFGVFNPEFGAFPYTNPNFPFEKLPFYLEDERDYPKMNMNKILISNSKDIKSNKNEIPVQPKVENRPFLHTELKQSSESSDKNDSFAKNTPDFPRVGPFVQSSDKRFLFTNPQNLQNRNIFGPIKFCGGERKNNINKSTDSNSIISYSMNQSMLSANSAFKKSSSGSGSGSGNSFGHNLIYNNNADLNKEYFSSISLDEKNNK